EWLSFYDLFKANIHANKKLEDVQKLQYLKSSVKGEAEKLLSTVQVIGTNYSTALQILEERYQNEREIVFDHIKRLVTQPNVNADSAKSLRDLVDTTSQCIGALSALNRNPENWNDIIVYLMLQKLDADTRRLWEISLDDKK
ncbi:unnamed protein product, partial [Allacma fusca]